MSMNEMGGNEGVGDTLRSVRDRVTDKMNEYLPQSHAEGRIARAIEEQTAKLPSDTFLWAAGGAIVGSLLMHLAGRRQSGLLLGQWVPSLLILGLYNKLVKLEGHD